MLKQRIPEARTSDEGFTLVELLIVIVVLGILASIVVFGVATFRQDAKTTACASEAKTVSVAADAYDAKTGGYPSDVASLVSAKYLKTTPNGTYTFDTTAKTVTQSGCTL